MDNIGGYLGNATDGIGQGLAYVLPNSRTESYAIQLNQEAAAQQRAQALLLEKQKQQQQADYAKQLYKQVIPRHDAQWDKHIQDMQQSYINDAAAYQTQTGKNPFIQPDFINRHNDIVSTAANSKQASANAVKYATLYNSDHDNKIDPADKQKMAAALQLYHDDPVKNAHVFDGLTVNSRPYDVTDLMKTITPTPKTVQNGDTKTVSADSGANLNQLRNSLTDPKFAGLLKRNGVTQSTFGQFGLPGPTGGTIYTTNPDRVSGMADTILSGSKDPNNPAMLLTLQHLGINPEDPSAKNKLVDYITNENQNTGKFLSGLSTAVDAKVKPQQLYNPNYDLSAERLNMARERLDMARQTHSTQTAQTPVQTLVYGNPATQQAGMQQGDATAINKALSLIPKGQYGKSFDPTQAFTVDPQTGEHIFTFPAQVTKDQKNIDANNKLRAAYQPQTHWFKPDDPKSFDQSKGASKLLPETKEVAPPKVYRLNPEVASYGSEAAQMLAEQKANLPRLNQTEGVKAGHGQIQQAQRTPAGTPLNNPHKKQASDYGL